MTTMRRVLLLVIIIASFISGGSTFAGPVVEFSNLPGREPAHLVGYLARPGVGLSALQHDARRSPALSSCRRVAWLRGHLQPFGGDRRSARRVGLRGFDNRYSGPRRMDGGCYSGTFVDQAFDAYAALRYLSTLKVVDAGRVAVLGQSMGGSATLYAIDRDLTAQYFDQRFRAAIAYYPRCTVASVPVMTAPVLILIGEADQWNRADACKTLRNLASLDSASIGVTVYPGVHHAFDVAQLKPGRSSDGRWLEYDEVAARDAEEKTRAFLAEHLAGMPAPSQSSH